MLNHKEDYERLIEEYPPYSDISFATLQIWWNLEGQLSLSMLNNNIIIHYCLPFDAANSGYSLLGKHLLAESMHTMFSYLKEQNQPVQLVHVPEFVVNNIAKPHDFVITEELDYNEYILDSHALSKLDSPSQSRTRKGVNRFLREVEGRKVDFRQLDLSSSEVQAELFKAIASWEDARISTNDRAHTEHQAIQKALAHAEHLGIRHVGLFIDDKLYAIIIYHRPQGKDHYIMHHLKVDYSIPYIFDYMTHHIANKAVEEDVNFLNVEMDLGIEKLRAHKMVLRPVDFFRKYTITPAD